MVRLEVSPEILNWAVVRTGNPDEVYVRFPNLSKWINHEVQPTFKQIEDFAKKTSTPLGYFFLKKPPDERLPIPHYRTLTDKEHTLAPSPNLLETVQTIERRQEWLYEYLISERYDPLDFVGSKKLGDNPTKIAKEMREIIGLDDKWAAQQPTWQDALRTLYHKVEEARIFLVVNGIVGNNTHRKLDVAEFRGFVLVNKYAPFIFINGTDGKAAQMFTLAHELAHIWYGVSAAFDLQELQPANEDIEIACNKVAAEFLVPEAELRDLWANALNQTDCFQWLARHFKVSEIVAARKALDLSLISQEQFFAFYNNRLASAVAASGSGGNFYATQNYRVGRRFAETVVRATKEGKLLYNEAYRLTGLSGKTFTEFAEQLGIGGNA